MTPSKQLLALLVVVAVAAPVVLAAAAARAQPHLIDGLLQGPPAEEFGKCEARCRDKYKTCMEDGGLTSLQPCFYDDMLDCACDCKRTLPAPQRASMSAVAVPAEQQQHALGGDDGDDDFVEAYRCWSFANQVMANCTEPCEATQDDDCAVACLRPYVASVCECDPRGKPGYSTASPATSPPTRPTPPTPQPGPGPEPSSTHAPPPPPPPRPSSSPAPPPPPGPGPHSTTAHPETTTAKASAAGLAATTTGAVLVGVAASWALLARAG